MRILIVKPGGIGNMLHALPAVAAVSEAMPKAEISRMGEPRSDENLGDNPLLDRLIEVGTKAPRRGLMSGETLRAPRQQLRRLRASAFVLDFHGHLNPPQLRAFRARVLFLGSCLTLSASSLAGFYYQSPFQFREIVTLSEKMYFWWRAH